MFILWPLGAILGLVLAAVTMVLAPVLALFCKSDGNLPRYLYWFQTFDATLDEGRQPQYGFTGSDWWVRTRWLWRNPGYGFDMYLLGVPYDPSQWYIKRNDADVFFAYSRSGAFCYETKTGTWRVKLGWKYWNYVDSENWNKYEKIPICCSISR